MFVYQTKEITTTLGALLNLGELKFIYFQILKMNLYFVKKKKNLAKAGVSKLGELVSANL